MKIIKKHSLSDLKKLKTELMVSFGMNCESFSKFYSYSETQNCVYVILEYANNGLLKNELKNNSEISELSEIRVREIIRSLVKGIVYLNSKGLSLGGINIDNIILSGSDKYLIYNLSTVITRGNIDYDKYKEIDILFLGITILDCLFPNNKILSFTKKQDNITFYNNYIKYYRKTIKFDSSIYSESLNHFLTELLTKFDQITIKSLLSSNWLKEENLACNRRKFHSLALDNVISYKNFYVMLKEEDQSKEMLIDLSINHKKKSNYKLERKENKHQFYSTNIQNTENKKLSSHKTNLITIQSDLAPNNELIVIDEKMIAMSKYPKTPSIKNQNNKPYFQTERKHRKIVSFFDQNKVFSESKDNIHSYDNANNILNMDSTEEITKFPSSNTNYIYSLNALENAQLYKTSSNNKKEKRSVFSSIINLFNP